MKRLSFIIFVLVLALALAGVITSLLFHVPEISGSIMPDQDVSLGIRVLDPSVVTIELAPTADEISGAIPLGGTGMILDRDGTILTSKHLIKNTQKTLVILRDGSRHEADLISQHPTLDLAKIRISGSIPDHITPIKLATTQADRVVGERVIAIGNSLGVYPHTASVGIIAALDRDITIQGQNYDGLIQTNISLSLGNSGGPLADIHGHVIGINTAIAGGSSHIGWAIPLDASIISSF